MDKRRLFIAMSLAVGLVLVWPYVLNYLDKKFNWNLAGQRQEQTSSDPGQAAPPGGGGPGTAPTTGTSPTTGALPTEVEAATTGPALARGLHAVPASADAAKPFAIGAAAKDDPTYAMQAQLSPIGAGMESVVL